MTAIAVCFEPLRFFGSLNLGIWALGTSDRRGQDKARKVRAVGWGGRHRRISVIKQTLRKLPPNLRFSATRYRRSAFHNLGAQHGQR
jgi:hypothetical protein